MKKISKWISVGISAVLGAIIVLPFYVSMLVLLSVTINNPSNFFSGFEFFADIYFGFWPFPFIWVMSIIASPMIGYQKGRAWSGFFLGLFLSWVGVAIITVKKPKPVEGNGEPGA